MEVLKCFGEESQKILKLFEQIALSRRTITRRTEQIGEFLYLETKQKTRKL